MITFRRLARRDFPLIARWLAEPHVAEWWNHQYTDDALEADFGETIDGAEPAEDFVAMLDGEPIGLMQYCHFVDYPDYVAEMESVYPVGEGAATIDYLVGEPGQVGRGIGSRMIAEFVEFVWAHDPWATHVVVPVNSANERILAGPAPSRISYSKRGATSNRTTRHIARARDPAHRPPRLNRPPSRAYRRPMAADDVSIRLGTPDRALRDPRQGPRGAAGVLRIAVQLADR